MRKKVHSLNEHREIVTYVVKLYEKNIKYDKIMNILGMV